MRSRISQIAGTFCTFGLAAMMDLCAFFPIFAADVTSPVFTWTGNGSSDLYTDAQNWPSDMPTQFFQSDNGLLTTATRGKYVIPEGFSTTIYGFDISNVTLEFNGDLTSVCNPRFNGFWMRGNTAVVLGQESNVTFLNGGAADTQSQITIGGANNQFDYYSSGKMSCNHIHLSSYDYKNNTSSNHFNQYDGTIETTHLWVGTYSVDGKENTLNLYGGDFIVSNTLLMGHDTRKNTHGNGVINIYDGSFTAAHYRGFTATIGGEQYTPSINLHIGGTDGSTFGTFKQTGTTAYEGILSVQMSTPLTVLDSSILNTNIVSLNSLTGKEQWDIETKLFKLAEDGKSVSLDASKKLPASDNYAVNQTLEFQTGLSEGWLELPESSNPYTMELFTEGLKDQAAADDFAAWLDEEFFLDAAALDASTIQVELFSGMDSDIFMFDFTGYDAANVMLQGFRTSEVPEPSAWILFSLGVFGLAGFRTKKAPKVQAA